MLNKIQYLRNRNSGKYDNTTALVSTKDLTDLLDLIEVLHKTIYLVTADLSLNDIIKVKLQSALATYDILMEMD
jgi:hypothetical protein